MRPRFWLMKTEPEAFSIWDLRKRPRKTEGWDGVRNYQARNNLQAMQKGDKALFYHSNAAPAGVIGIVRISKPAYPDVCALNPESKYYDARAKPDKNPWVMVDVTFEKEFSRLIPLAELRQIPGLEKMEVLRVGSRLSVQPVTAEEFSLISGYAEGIQAGSALQGR